jgi:D-glycero-D-manno-heptose 1,7-bisphosphate phosphatase
VFLDRDGVLNGVVLSQGRPYPPASLDDFAILPGVPQAVHALRDAGFRLIVVTNQPDVATGRQRREVVEAMHRHLRERLPLDDVKVCYHVDADDCRCRKPRPGMLLEAAREWSLRLEESFLVGDRWRDIAAGKAAGCRTILIDGHYAERRAESPDATVASLLEASRFILAPGA